MDTLEQARAEIDAVDAQLAALFERRMAAVLAVAAYKKAHGLPIFDAAREKVVLDKAEARIGDPALRPYYRDHVQNMMDVAKQYEAEVLGRNRAAYQGVEGAFAHIALKALFPHAEAISYPTWDEVFDAVERGDASHGVVPFENSHAGDVSAVLDLCYNHPDLWVVDVYDLPISQNLLVLPGTQLNELKMDMTGLNMLAGWTTVGDTIMIEQMPILGGYTGGVEETAICDVATTLGSFACFSGNFHLDGPIHIRWGTTMARGTLQVAAHAAAAIDANTDLLLANQYYPIAGPCTEMCLLETAAQAITDTASGRELLSGVASSKGVSQDKTTGMEARMMGEAALATCGMEIPEVNRVLDRVVGLYEKNFGKAPQGKRFQDCYNVKDVEPSDEYIDLYDDTIKTLLRCGIEL